MTRRSWLLMLPVLAVAAVTVAVARRQPEWALAGSPGGLAIEVSAGIALALAALVIRARGPDPRSAALLYGASIAWLVAEWNNPGAPGAVVFTLGMVFDVHGSRTRRPRCSRSRNRQRRLRGGTGRGRGRLPGPDCGGGRRRNGRARAE